MNWQKGVYRSAELNHKKNIARKKIIKNSITDWVIKNENIVLNCPYNKITSTLVGLNVLLIEKYNIKDLRSIYICFEVKNLRSLLDKLKEIIYISKENVC